MLRPHPITPYTKKISGIKNPKSFFINDIMLIVFEKPEYQKVYPMY